MKKHISLLLVALVAAFVMTGTAWAQAPEIPTKPFGAYVPFEDLDTNSFPDSGVSVSGQYDVVLGIDQKGNFYFDFGSGVPITNVDSVKDLDRETRQLCVTKVIYEGEWDNSLGMINGWVLNREQCHRYFLQKPTTLVMLIVHQDDPRFTGDPELAFPYAFSCCWEFHLHNESGSGNQLE